MILPCYNPGKEVTMTLVATTGRCHICRQFEVLEPIKCTVRKFNGDPGQEHWLCRRCATDLSVEHINALLAGAELDCCGPVVRVA
jgi:hypothetical protein